MISELIKPSKSKLLLQFFLDDKQKSNGNQKISLADCAIAVHGETVSNTDNTNKRLNSTLGRWYSQNALTDTFTIDNLLSKLNSENVAVVSCMSPIDRIDLPF